MRSARSRWALGLLVSGVNGIFVGEALCLLGPLRYERVVHAVCHVMLYTGSALAGLGAAVYLVDGWRRRPRQSR